MERRFSTKYPRSAHKELHDMIQGILIDKFGLVNERISSYSFEFDLITLKEMGFPKDREQASFVLGLVKFYSYEYCNVKDEIFETLISIFFPELNCFKELIY